MEWLQNIMTHHDRKSESSAALHRYSNRSIFPSCEKTTPSVSNNIRCSRCPSEPARRLILPWLLMILCQGTPLVGQGRHGVAHLSGRTFPNQPGYLAVTGDFPLRNVAYPPVDFIISAHQ